MKFRASKKSELPQGCPLGKLPVPVIGGIPEGVLRSRGRPEGMWALWVCLPALPEGNGVLFARVFSRLSPGLRILTLCVSFPLISFIHIILIIKKE